MPISLARKVVTDPSVLTIHVPAAGNASPNTGGGVTRVLLLVRLGDAAGAAGCGTTTRVLGGGESRQGEDEGADGELHGEKVIIYADRR